MRRLSLRSSTDLLLIGLLNLFSDVLDVFSRIKGGILALTTSLNGNFLAVSTTQGVIGVLNLRQSPPQLFLVMENPGYSPHILRFSHDSSSQLITLDVNGILKTYLLNGNPLAKPAALSWLVRL